MNIKGFNIKAIFEYIKKRKLYFGGALVAVVLLVIAFFSGGSLSDSPKNLSDAPVSVSSSYDEVLTNTETTNAELSSVVSNSDNKKEKNENNLKSSSNSSSNSKKNSKVLQTENTANADSDINLQSSQTDNAQLSSSASPYSKEYYYPGNSETASSNSSGNSQSAASGSNQNKYNTESIPEGKPQPVEPQDQEIEDNELTCTISINCATILDNLDKFNPDKIELVPKDGWILKPTKVKFNEGESAYDLLVRVCKENKIHMTARWTPIYNSHYIESINNIKEFDCPTDRFHNTSGWMYCVNDWYPNYGVSRYELKNGDVVEFNYTCVGLGADLGAEYATGG